MFASLRLRRYVALPARSVTITLTPSWWLPIQRRNVVLPRNWSVLPTRVSTTWWLGAR